MTSKKAFVSSLKLGALCCLACETTFTPPAGSGGAPVDTGVPIGTQGGAGGGGTSGGGAVSGSGAMLGGGAGGGVGGASVSGGGAGGAPMGGIGGTATAGAGGTALGAGGAPPAETCPATSTLKPGTTNGTIQFGGTTRSYIVHVPASYTGAKPVPLVTDYHGILLNNSLEESISGWQAKSDQEGFIVAWPNGIDTAWNVGPCCTTSRTVDDVGFAKAVVNQIASQACIDKKRVYAVGYSMGGGMSLDLACNAADVFAAIAPSAFDLMDASNNWICKPSRPITVVDFRSTGDPVVPYNGGPTNPPNGLPVVVTFLGAVKTFQKFAELDQCTGSPTSDSALGAGCQTYSQCAAGVQVTLCTKQGGGHDPGDPAVAWNVLKNYTLP